MEQFKADLLRRPFVLFSWVLDAYWAHHCLVFIDASVVKKVLHKYILFPYLLH